MITPEIERVHTVNQLLKAYAMFDKDVEYIVVDNKTRLFTSRQAVFWKADVIQRTASGHRKRAC